MPVTRDHQYQVRVAWTGNTGQGTATYNGYSRSHEISMPHKAPIHGTTEVPRFHEKSSYTPEELLVGALSACHMMWTLHMCADAGINVVSYIDEAEGTMHPHGQSGQFTEVILRPLMKITDGARIADAEAAHEEAHRLCNIARSVNFPVHCEPKVVAE